MQQRPDDSRFGDERTALMLMFVRVTSLDEGVFLVVNSHSGPSEHAKKNPGGWTWEVSE